MYHLHCTWLVRVMFSNLLFVADWVERHTYVLEQHVNQPQLDT